MTASFLTVASPDRPRRVRSSAAGGNYHHQFATRVSATNIDANNTAHLTLFGLKADFVEPAKSVGMLSFCRQWVMNCMG